MLGRLMPGRDFCESLAWRVLSGWQGPAGDLNTSWRHFGMRDGIMNKKSATRRLFGGLLLFSLFVGGCAMGSAESRPARIESLHPDAKSDITEQVGAPVTFKLPGNAGTGYEWVIAGDLPSFLSQQGKSRFVPNDLKKVGAGGDSEFVLIASGPGKGVVRFHYLQSWKKGARPARWAEVEVTANTSGH